MPGRPFDASPDLDLLTTALVAAHGDMPAITKGHTVSTGKYSYTYADLSQILSVARPVLARHGLVVLQPATVDQKGSVTIRTILLHVSAQWLSESLTVPVTDAGDAQKLGSAMSYGRRYSYCSLLGIQPEDEDDDGVAAQEKARGRKAEQRHVETESGEDYITEAQKNRLLAILKEHKVVARVFGDHLRQVYRVDGWNVIRRRHYDEITALAQNWTPVTATGREPGSDD